MTEGATDHLIKCQSRHNVLDINICCCHRCTHLKLQHFFRVSFAVLNLAVRVCGGGEIGFGNKQ